MNGGTYDRIIGRWLRSTWLGWILGIPAIAVMALIGEAIGLGGSQFLVGLGMGLAVGFMQSRVLRDIITSPAKWLWITAAGLCLPFLAFDLARVFEWSLAYSLYYAVAAGGFLVGAGQAWLLRRRSSVAWIWVPASLIGWGLAAGSAALADLMFQSGSIRGISGLLAYVGVIASGGLALGAVTGFALPKMLSAAVEEQGGKPKSDEP